MAIYRGSGGSGDSSTDVTRDEVAAFTAEAKGYRDEALVSKTDADSSSTTATTEASTATTKATEASASATSAASSATAAAADLVLTNADVVLTNADVVLTNADVVLTAADVVLTAADVTLATTQAGLATTNGAAQVTLATTQAALATTQAGLATTNGAAQVTLATAQVTLATTQATNAASSATTATTQASAASTSATSAATQATTATTKASEASTSATSAATSETNAAASYDSFDDRYLGAKSSAPTLDNDGDALLTGAIYWNTTSDSLFIWNGSTWDAAAFSASGTVTSFNTREGAVTLSSGDVSAVGALMDSEVTNLAQVKAFSSSDYATAAQGTTADAAQIATADYDVGDNVKIKLGDTDDLQMWHTGSYSIIKDAGTGSLIIESDGTGIELKKGADHLAKFNTDSSVQLFHAGSEKLHTTSTGIDVTGSVTAYATTANSQLYLTSPDTGQAAVNFGGTTSSAKGSIRYSDSSDWMSVYTASAERLRIDSAGNVGIGTSSPSAKLHVSGSAQMDGDLKVVSSFPRIYLTDTDTNSDFSIINYNGSFTVFDDTNNSRRLDINSAGNVGIGTSSPSAKLAVSGSFSASGGINNGASQAQNTANHFTLDNIANVTRLYSNGADTATSGDFQFNTSRSNGTSQITALTIKGNGNVGIGTSSPAQKLQIESSSEAGIRLNNTMSNNWDITNDSNLKFTRGSTERMRIDSSGNVGIGTSSPSAKLTVTDTNGIALRLGDVASAPVSQTACYIGTGTSALAGGVNGDLFLAPRSSTTANILLYTGNGTSAERMRITSTGNVGIGTSSPSEKLYVSGNIYATGNVTAYSDERIKKNINEIPNALDAVDAIRGVTYTRTDTEEDSVGVIAQEVEAMFPELITENNEGMKSVNYNGLIGVLFSAVKELSAKVRKLEND
jgi:hypothetical protein